MESNKFHAISVADKKLVSIIWSEFTSWNQSSATEINHYFAKRTLAGSRTRLRSVSIGIDSVGL